MKIWNQVGNYKTVSEYLCSKTGLHEDCILNPSMVDMKGIQNMKELKERIEKAVIEKTTINVVGDYDADGITSTAILYILFTVLGLKTKVSIPRRFSDGYGLSARLVDKIEEGIIITVDNGISAIPEIRKAKEMGFDVLVLDHHLPKNGQLPPADIIVDPHVHPEYNSFCDYCGAGLAYKLADFLLYDPIGFTTAQENGYNVEHVMKTLLSFACVGTVADSMPLVGENRIIVKNGLKVLNEKKSLTYGLRAIVDLCNDYTIDEETIKFKIAPMLNAPGRMYDAGAISALKAILCNNHAQSLSYANKIREINEDRKAKTKQCLEIVENVILENHEADSAPICIYIPDIPEGIVGILAGDVAQQYRMPTFILTNTENGVLKGSARSYGDYSIENAVSDILPLLISGGGHAGAAGLSLHEEKFQTIKKVLKKSCSDYIKPDNSMIDYDIILTDENAEKIMAELKLFAPFGVGNPKPLFCIKNFSPVEIRGNKVLFMGNEKQHFKLAGDCFHVVGFNMAEIFENANISDQIQILGDLTENHYAGNVTLQIRATEVFNGAV